MNAAVLSIPKFEPWRFLRPLRMLNGQWHPKQRIQFSDEVNPPAKISAGAVQEYVNTFTGDKASESSATVTIPITYGAADGSRLVVVGGSICFQAAGGAVTVSSPTIGGVSASFLALASPFGANRAIHILAWATVPSGTGGDFVFTISAAKLQEEYAFKVWRATGLSSNTAHDTASSSVVTTVSIDVPTNGFLIASFDSTADRSFSAGVTANGSSTQLTTQTDWTHGGSATFLTSETNRSVTISGSANMSAVSFG